MVRPVDWCGIGPGVLLGLTRAVAAGERVLVSQPVYGDPDGFGVYGVLQHSDDGLLVRCHDCGEWFEPTLACTRPTSTTAPPTTGFDTG